MVARSLRSLAMESQDRALGYDNARRAGAASETS